MIPKELNSTPLGDQVYQLLKTAVLNGDFAPGEKLSPPDLSRRLRVSVTPIRDSLRRLEAEGLIQVIPRRGTFVFRFTAQDVKEVFESRRLIEQTAAEKLPTAPDAILQRMAALVEAMADLTDGENARDYPRYLELDKDFHNSIVAILENRRLSEFYHSLRAYTYVARALVPAAERRISQTHAEHCEILVAFQQRDVARAKQAIATHLERGMADILHKAKLSSNGATGA